MPFKKVSNWGNFPAVNANFIESSDISEIQALVNKHKGLIARGNGRCYGDSSLSENIFSTLRLNRFLSFNPAEGTLECESGVLLSDILDVIVPQRFFLPVTPGTKFITLGGAIAADVHGKNHHCEGSFANHVIHFNLLQSNGDIVKCSRDENPELFWQTCGGMGLTGIILNAKFRLKPVETSYVRQITCKASGLEQVMRLFEESGSYTYSVAWLDCFAPRRQLGRSIVRFGEHSSYEELPSKLQKEPLRLAPKSGFDIRFYPPSFSVNYATVKVINSIYYHEHPIEKRENFAHFDRYFYPLDSIRHWNRVYGRHGFVQYQFVLPKENSFDGLKMILENIRESGQGSPLAVLKLFGKQDPNAVMSFPMEGYTLALDFKVNPKVFRLLDELDLIVLRNNGRLNLAKDARMSPDIFRRTYSNIVPSNGFSSHQSNRLGI